jgi:lipoprotein-anchoring transpeptidase ErfK/SrfK
MLVPALLVAIVALGGACSTKSNQQFASAAVPQVTTTIAKPAEYRQILWASVPKVNVFQAPDASAPASSLKNPTAEAQPLAFLAIDHQPDWFKVLMPVRPNSVVGWIHASDVKLGDIPVYRVLIEVGAQRLTVFKGDEQVMQEQVGVGKSVTPTPLGTFYVDAMVKLRNANGVYGPYQLSLSGFSNVLQHFGGGIGQIAMHGTNMPQLIPGNISNGCIRIKNASISHMVDLGIGIGTPVDIVA